MIDARVMVILKMRKSSFRINGTAWHLLDKKAVFLRSLPDFGEKGPEKESPVSQLRRNWTHGFVRLELK
jgi:hypothetical protein